MDLIQTRKILSNVNQIFQPSYNRVTWEISPIGGMATDLTKSYVAFRMYLTKAIDSKQVTAAHYAELLAKNLMIEFGQNSFSYPAASLIQVARLYARNDTGSPLEEILYQNVWAATMHQLSQDLETIASNTLASGTAVTFNTNGSLASQISCLMKSSVSASNDAQLPLEIHIPLSSIFGLCKNSHMDLSLLGGLIIQFELEPVKHLFQTRSIGKRVPMPLAIDASGVGFAVQPEVSPWTFLPKDQGYFGQPSYQFATTQFDASGNALVQPPDGYHYANNVHSFFNTENPTGTSTDTITLKGIWTADQLTGAKIVVGNTVKLNFKWQDTSSRMRSKMIECFDSIQTVTPSATINETTITLLSSYRAPIGISVSTVSNVTLESFDIFESPVADVPQTDAQALLIGIVNDEVDVTHTPPALFYNNQLSVPEDIWLKLESMGVLVVNEAGSYSGNGQFRLMVQPQSLGTTYVTPWIDQFDNPDSATIRKIWSAQAKALSIQGTECQLLSASAADASGNRILTFKDFGLENNNSLQFGCLVKDTVGSYATQVPNVSGQNNIVFKIYLLKSRNQTASSSLEIIDQYSYQIDKAEIVLVEMTLDPSIPQTMVYETMRVEVATIETDILDVYNRQFVCNEPSITNLFLLTPQYVNSGRLGRSNPSDLSGNSFYYEHPECLVSYARNVSQYRWAINNIQDTNRYVEVETNTSKYPSSLHLEKLMDTFSNTTEKMKNFSGIMTVPRTNVDPVVCFPLRIYEAMDDTNTYMREGGFQAQIELLSDAAHNKDIVSGAIFLFKQMLKTIH
tara:strand:+ start:1986 stop:4376 length:2391 start_codon:yes stop_codon:yes gene_type:complete